MAKGLRYDHYLYIIAFISAVFLSLFSTFPAISSAMIGRVLGDDDDNSGSGGGGNDDDEDEDDDDNDDNSGSDDDDEDEEKERKEAAKREKERLKKGEKLLEEKKKQEAKSKTRERIVNPDGTTTEIRREQDGNKTKVEIRRYDAAGNKIEVQEYKGEEGKEESRAKTYDAAGNKLSDIRLKTEDGKELELRVKEGTESSRVRFDAEKQELEIRQNNEVRDNGELAETPELEDEGSRVRIRAEGEGFTIHRSGINAQAHFPISVDEETGQIFVETPSGNVELRAMPDTIVEKASIEANIDIIEDVSIEENEDTDTVAYVITGIKSENFLGFFAVDIPNKVIYDAETGEFVKNETSFTNRILDLFSF